MAAAEAEAAQQEQFGGATIQDVEEAEAEAAQQEQFGGATIADVEDFLLYKSSWGNLLTRLIPIFLGIMAVVYGAVASGLPREDRIAIGVVSCVNLLLGAGLIWLDVYVRLQLECLLEQMQSAALDVESPGEQS